MSCRSMVFGALAKITSAKLIDCAVCCCQVMTLISLKTKNLS